MKKSERELLMRTREQAILVRTLRERCREEMQLGLRAFDPEAGGGCGGLPRTLDAQVIRREEFMRILTREERQLVLLEQRARAVVDALPLQLRSFCALYYLGALPLARVSEVMDRCPRTLKRYRRMLEEEA